ncbi:MAG: chromosomal replication initiator protein DnaA [Opitutaceae bacterium]|jgi:chromosomal replication initiator protein|nr:chromosomal replication initiator protein DnaA [Opitutaceae bacterium]
MPSSTSTETTAIADAPALWARVKADLKTLFPEDLYALWFEPMTLLEAAGDALVIGVPNDFAAIWIQDNYADLIAQRLLLQTGLPLKPRIRKNPGAAAPRPAVAETPARVAAETSRRRAAPANAPASPVAGLNSRNTFANYIVGSNNRLAHAAALAVAQAPGQAYNPLFIYGNTGLGKTHLMHAIGHAVCQTAPERRVACVTAEKFTNDYVQAIRENTFAKFRQHYRKMDVLILDDIQFLGGKEGVQEEFFHTFNDLHTHGKQIVLSSDRRAADIQRLEERLVTRLQWGLVTDIQTPDYETRLAILNAKAKTLRYELPGDIAELMARHITQNIRALEGALLKVASHATLTGGKLDAEGAAALLGDALRDSAREAVTPEAIQQLVAEHYRISLADMVGKKRPQGIVFPRQVAMWLCRRHTRHSLQEIGAFFGKRDHGTVIHAIKTVDNIAAQDPATRGALDLLNQKLSR